MIEYDRKKLKEKCKFIEKFIIFGFRSQYYAVKFKNV
jgi:hypothetical protein